MSRTTVKILVATAGFTGALVVGPGMLAAWSAAPPAGVTGTATSTVGPEGRHTKTPTAYPSRSHSKSPSKSPSQSPSKSPSKSPSQSPSHSASVSASATSLPVTGGTSSGTIGGLVLGGVAAVGLGTAMYRNGRRRLSTN